MIRIVDQGLFDGDDVHRPGVDGHRLEPEKLRVRHRHEGIGHPVDLTVRDLVRRRDLLSQDMVAERTPVWDIHRLGEVGRDHELVFRILPRLASG